MKPQLSVCLAGLKRKREVGGHKESPSSLAEVKYPELPEGGASATIPNGM